jgi:hypothetical protein
MEPPIRAIQHPHTEFDCYPLFVRDLAKEFGSKGIAAAVERISVVNRAGDEDRGKPLSETARENGRLDGDERRERSISRTC